MSDLFDTLSALRALRDSINPAWVKPTVDRFRETLLKLIGDAKKTYCEQVLDGHFLPDSQIKELLGYSSSSTVDAIRDGKISLDKFFLLQATIGRRVPLPSNTALLNNAFVETIDYVRRELMKQQPRTFFDLAAYHCVEQSFVEDLTARELELEGEEKIWLKHLLKNVQAVVPVKNIKKPGDLESLLIEWAPAYLATKNALGNLVRE